MHLSAPRRTGIGVDASGKQRVGEANPIAFDADNAFAFGLFEEYDGFGGGDAFGLGQQVYGRIGDTSRGQQYVTDFVVEIAYPGTHQLSQRAWQLLFGGR